MGRGIFITVEGMDGSGKTTQFRLMSKYLKDAGIPVTELRDPGGTGVGERIRQIVLDSSIKDMSSMTELLLYAASRAQLVEKAVKPALACGECVICDRFVDSNIAYQGYGRGITEDTIYKINSYASDIKPDITFFFDLSPLESMKRTQGKCTDRIEQEGIEFHSRVYSGYKKLAECNTHRIEVIDCRKDIDAVFREVKSILDERVLHYLKFK